MLGLSEAQTAAVRTAFDEGGEFSAAIELRRILPHITSNVIARKHARVIAGRELSIPPPPRSPLHEVVPLHQHRNV
jgi:hypothetical protein